MSAPIFPLLATQNKIVDSGQSYSMSKIRPKRLRSQKIEKIGAYDDSLLFLTLERNQRCIEEIAKGQFEKADSLLREIKTDMEMISVNSRERKIARALSLNTEAVLLQKKKEYELALRCLDQAVAIQRANCHDAADQARTLLNKCVIYSLMNRHDEAVVLAKEALQMLQERKEDAVHSRKHRYKVYEIMIVSFYNIAVELSHLQEVAEAHKIYREGYTLAHKILGRSHKLTVLLRSIVKTQRKEQQSKEREPSESSLKKRERRYLSLSEKEKELKKIYLSSKVSIETIDEKPNRRESYYRSLRKAQSIYKPTEGLQKPGLHLQEPSRRQKMQTETSAQIRYSEPSEHKDIKSIILSGKMQLRQRSSQMNYLSLSEKEHIQVIKTAKQIPKEEATLPELPPIQIHTEGNVQYQKEQLGPQKQARETGEACQLI